MTTTNLKILIASFVFVLVAGCGTARELDAYRADTQKLLETRSSDIKSCYDEALKADKTAAGTVTVQFVVEKETGTITSAKVDAAKTTAPAALGQCVVKAIEGLKLDPPDRNEGQATFVYEFKPTPAST